MSPRLRIYYNAVFGGLGGLLGWLLISLYVPALPGHIVLSDAVWGSIVGVTVGGLLGTIDGMFLRSVFRLARGLLYGAGAGFVAGLVGLPVGEAAFLVLGGGTQARAAGWSIFGLAIGMSEGLANRMPRKTSYGAVGGALGGAIGGILFEFVVRIAILQALGRAFGLVILGACIGSLIGSVEEVLKRAWIKVVSGRSEGREYALLKPAMIIGRDERADIPLFGDTTVQPRHAEIRQSGREHTLIPLGLPVAVNRQPITTARPLHDGDLVRVGNTELLYRLRRSAAIASATLLALWLLAGPSVVMAAPVARVAQVDKSQFPTVRVYVSVLDPSGIPIQGLRATDFQLFEDGRPVPITEFVGGKDAPITVMLIMDRSGSMGDQGKLNAAREAAKAFLRLLRADDQVGLVVFSESPQILSRLTTDTAAVSTLLQQVSPGGGTAHYDGVVEGLKMLRTATGRRAVISLTDGMDNQSRNRLETVLVIARDDNIPVYTIGLGSQGFFGGFGAAIDERPLQRLAAESGGQYFYAPDASALETLYRTVLEQIEREYRLGYRSPRPELDGTRRAVLVRVGSTGGAAEARGAYLIAGVIGAVRSARIWPIFFFLLVPLLTLLFLPRISRRLGKDVRRLAESGHKPITSTRRRRFFPLMVLPGIRKTSRSTEAAVSRYWRLVPKGGGKSVPIQDRIRVGRARGNDIVVRDPSVAPVHAEIWSEGNWVILQAQPGANAWVRVKGANDVERLVIRSTLQAGSIVRFGAAEYVLEAPDSPKGS